MGKFHSRCPYKIVLIKKRVLTDAIKDFVKEKGDQSNLLWHGYLKSLSPLLENVVKDPFQMHSVCFDFKLEVNERMVDKPAS